MKKNYSLSRNVLGKNGPKVRHQRGEATIGRVYIRYGLTSRLANFIYAMTL